MVKDGKIWIAKNDNLQFFSGDSGQFFHDGNMKKDIRHFQKTSENIKNRQKVDFFCNFL